MIVHVASFLESIGGSIDKDHYLRPIPGRVGYAAYCREFYPILEHFYRRHIKGL